MACSDLPAGVYTQKATIIPTGAAGATQSAGTAWHLVSVIKE